jgi:hypothetical protein
MFCLSMLHTGEMERFNRGKKVRIRASTEKNSQDEQSHERLIAFTRLSTQTNPPELAVVTLNVALIVV